jgi:hypothetical protein
VRGTAKATCSTSPAQQPLHRTAFLAFGLPRTEYLCGLRRPQATSSSRAQTPGKRCKNGDWRSIRAYGREVQRPPHPSPGRCLGHIQLYSSPDLRGEGAAIAAHAVRWIG